MRDTGPTKPSNTSKSSTQIAIIRVTIIIACLVILARLFDIQVLKFDEYRQKAKNVQYKQLQIEPERGSIYMLSGEDEVLLVTNESRYLIFADPQFVKDPKYAASRIAPILGLSPELVVQKLISDTRYEIIAKNVGKDKKSEIESLKEPGIAWQEQRIRSYPQGTTGSHILGFVNDDGMGQYGIEGYLDSELKGTPGQLRAVTDIKGIPLALNRDNIVQQPVNGTNLVLTIDANIQRIAEEELRYGVERSSAKSGSVVIMEVNSGRVKAMANYPSYDPSKYAEVDNTALFMNRGASEPSEPGSIIKTLTMATALDLAVVNENSTYLDPGVDRVDDVVIRNVENLGAGTRSMLDVLRYSLNTGAVHLLKQFGGGEINLEARSKLHSYYADRYGFNDVTGIEIEEEVHGILIPPDEGDGLRIQYANMAFGQGLSVTLTQFAGALSSAVNGGTYYKPTLVQAKVNDGQRVETHPQVVRANVISESSSSQLVSLMKEYSEIMLPEATRSGFVVGGKTGTAQVASPGGGYRDDVYNATFVGFVGRDTPKYVIVIKLDEGSAANDFSGFKDARPVFISITNAIMDNIPIL